MPFTFSHPAIILPLTCLPRRWYSLTGLIVGSVTPDFEYFLRMRVHSSYSHTIYGMFWFDLPLGIILAFLFHNIVRDSLFRNLPCGLRSRLMPYVRFDWNGYFRSNWLVVILSILVGAASHIGWDSFTHEHGYFTEKISMLTKNIELAGLQLPVFKILQHTSTIAGGLVLIIAIGKLPAGKNGSYAGNRIYWGLVTGITVLIVLSRLLSGLDYRYYGHLAATCISAGVIALVLTSLLIKEKETAIMK